MARKSSGAGKTSTLVHQPRSLCSIQFQSMALEDLCRRIIFIPCGGSGHDIALRQVFTMAIAH